MLSLDPEDCLKVLAVQQVNAAPDSLLLLDSPALGADGTEEGAGAGALFLHIGPSRSGCISICFGWRLPCPVAFQQASCTDTLCHNISHFSLTCREETREKRATDLKLFGRLDNYT